jgi:predicted small lipoprotein YifL
MAGGAGVTRAVLLALALLALAGCGRKAAPSPPGPSDQVTYPRAYPAY